MRDKMCDDCQDILDLYHEDNKIKDLREEYEKETGKDCINDGDYIIFFSGEYVEWLENKIKERI